MFFNSNITVLRQSAGGYNDDGVFIDGVTTELTIAANVQPINTRERAQYTQILPSGNRSAKLVKIYSATPLLLDAQTTGQKADVILWLNGAYKVIMAEEWQNNIISHYRYIAQELVNDDNE